jgi:hypothetical protein
MRAYLPLTVLGVALMTGSVEAGHFMAVGTGQASCGRWTQFRHDDNARLFQEWISGFISGVADASQSLDPSNPLDPAKGTDGDGIAFWIDNYCRDHPIDTIVKAAQAFIHAHPR